MSFADALTRYRLAIAKSKVGNLYQSRIVKFQNALARLLAKFEVVRLRPVGRSKYGAGVDHDIEVGRNAARSINFMRSKANGGGQVGNPYHDKSTGQFTHGPEGSTPMKSVRSGLSVKQVKMATGQLTKLFKKTEDPGLKKAILSGVNFLLVEKFKELTPKQKGERKSILDTHRKMPTFEHTSEGYLVYADRLRKLADEVKSKAEKSALMVAVAALMRHDTREKRYTPMTAFKPHKILQSEAA